MPGIKRKETQSQAVGQSPPKKFKKEDGDKRYQTKNHDGEQHKGKKEYDGKKAKSYTDEKSGDVKQPVVKEILDG